MNQKNIDNKENPSVSSRSSSLSSSHTDCDNPHCGWHCIVWTLHHHHLSIVCCCCCCCCRCCCCCCCCCIEIIWSRSMEPQACMDHFKRQYPSTRQEEEILGVYFRSAVYMSWGLASLTYTRYICVLMLRSLMLFVMCLLSSVLPVVLHSSVGIGFFVDHVPCFCCCCCCCCCCLYLNISDYM